MYDLNITHLGHAVGVDAEVENKTLRRLAELPAQLKGYGAEGYLLAVCLLADQFQCRLGIVVGLSHQHLDLAWHRRTDAIDGDGRD